MDWFTDTVVYISLLGFLSIVVLVGAMRFGARLFHEWYDHFDERVIWEVKKHGNRPEDMANIMAYAKDAREKRNRFWEFFGQVAIAIFITFAISLLLLTKTIEPDAGLPILTAAVSYVLGKGVSVGSPDERPSRRDRE